MATSDEAARSEREPASAKSVPRCPRCGGVGAPPRRKNKNPFTIDQVTCVDCGLDFEPATAWPW